MLASVRRHRWGSYLFLDKKVTKNQGLELMSDKFVKAFWSSAQVPPKGAESVCCLNTMMKGKGNDKALTFSPSIISYARKQGSDSEVQIA
ncbi:hypothetical protein ASE74_03385 [Pedobacter sp. Leaf216]|nr:hypothetical protein ASE74_03385 [Pedobacter sp. Leaf216]